MDAFLDFPTRGEKEPYTFEKYVNLLWTLPLVLFFLWVIYKVFRDFVFVKYILNVGKYSLIAFILCDYLFEILRLLVLAFGIYSSVFIQQLVGVFSIVLLTAILWMFRSLGGDKVWGFRYFAGR